MSQEQLVMRNTSFTITIPHSFSPISAFLRNSASGMLEDAIESLDEGKTKKARNKLNAFINHVQGLIGDGVLSAAEGQALIDDANNIRAELGLLDHRDP